MNAKAYFRQLLADRRAFARGTPDHEYRTRAARKLVAIIRRVPAVEWSQ